MTSTSATTYHDIIAAALIFAAVNSWSTVFRQAFDYYEPKGKGGQVFIGAILFAMIVTGIAVYFAKNI